MRSSSIPQVFTFSCASSIVRNAIVEQAAASPILSSVHIAQPRRTGQEMTPRGIILPNLRWICHALSRFSGRSRLCDVWRGNANSGGNSKSLTSQLRAVARHPYSSIFPVVWTLRVVLGVELVDKAISVFVVSAHAKGATVDVRGEKEDSS